jgi:hypothetical protein
VAEEPSRTRRQQPAVSDGDPGLRTSAPRWRSRCPAESARGAADPNRHAEIRPVHALPWGAELA